MVNRFDYNNENVMAILNNTNYTDEQKKALFEKYKSDLKELRRKEIIDRLNDYAKNNPVITQEEYVDVLKKYNDDDLSKPFEVIESELNAFKAAMDKKSYMIAMGEHFHKMFDDVLIAVIEQYDQKLAHSQQDSLVSVDIGGIWILDADPQPVAQYKTDLEHHNIKDDKVDVFEPASQFFFMHKTLLAAVIKERQIKM